MYNFVFEITDTVMPKLSFRAEDTRAAMDIVNCYVPDSPGLLRDADDDQPLFSRSIVGQWFSAQD